MPADDRNCTGHFGSDTFCLALHGLIYISGLVLGLLSTVIALLGVAVLLTYSPKNGAILLVMAFLISYGAAAGCDLVIGQGAEFEICDPG